MQDMLTTATQDVKSSRSEHHAPNTESGPSNPSSYDPSPFYTISQLHTSVLAESEPPPSTYSIFPHDIVFYRASYISLIIGPKYHANIPQPPPLFHVSIHMDNRFTNRSPIPQIRLHYGPSDIYPVIGSVRFRATTTSDITISSSSLSPDTNIPASETHVTLFKTGALTSALHTFTRVSEGREEKYEWRHSGDALVAALATENIPGENISQQNRGIKLVRIPPLSHEPKTIAVFSGGVHSRLYNPRRVAGKLRFVEDEEGEEVKLLAVMSILAIMERGRRNAVFNASGLYSCVVS